MSLLERRRFARVPLRAEATLRWGNQPLGRHAVINLGVGGLLLSGPAPAPVGTRVEVTLALDEQGEVVLSGHILRQHSTREGSCFVLVLGQLPAPLVMRIAARVEQILVQIRNAHVLVVDDSRKTGAELQAHLGQMGHAAHAVTTPLEALHLLGAPNRIGVAMIDRDLGTSDGLDLLAHLADQHPYLRRVLVSDGPVDRRLGAALRHRPQAAPHEVLARPLTESALARAVTPT